MKETTLDEFRAMAEQGEVVPVCREIPGDMDTPVSVLERFVQDDCIALLESVEGGENLGRYSFLGVNPYGLFTVEDGVPYLEMHGERRALSYEGNPLNALRGIIGGKKVAHDPELPPLPGGAIGCLNYEAAGLFEELPAPKGGVDGPVCAFMLTNEIIAFDNKRHTIKVVVNVEPKHFANVEEAFASANHRIGEIIKKICQRRPARSEYVSDAHVELQPEMTHEAFLEMVKNAKRCIVDGEVIQVVPSQAFSAESDIPPFSIYRALRLINPSPYMFYLKLGEELLIGSSPETLVKLENGVSLVRPIAGTRPRGVTAEKDAALEKSLLADEKERAEHLMLVDLGRNDIGRTAKPGSVLVADFMHVERYSHVMHLVSSVEGQLRDDCDAFDLVASAFPAGTLTGAPKIRAMELIHEFEPGPRGFYGGAVGYFSADGNMDLAITIRTIEVRDGRIKVQAGCGIVADSVPEMEYQETLNKARALVKAVEFAEKGLKS